MLWLGREKTGCLQTFDFAGAGGRNRTDTRLPSRDFESIINQILTENGQSSPRKSRPSKKCSWDWLEYFPPWLGMLHGHCTDRELLWVMSIFRSFRAVKFYVHEHKKRWRFYTYSACFLHASSGGRPSTQRVSLPVPRRARCTAFRAAHCTEKAAVASHVPDALSILP